MFLLFSGVVGTIVLGGTGLFRAKRELELERRLSVATVLLSFANYLNLTVCILLTAWWSMWPLPLSPAPAQFAGAALVIVGAGCYLTARTRFGSFRLTWGLSLDRFVTDGYQFSRNPQVVGAILLLGGVAFWGRSGAAMALLIGYMTISALWIRAEERALERQFGESYRRYRSRVPRFV